MKKTFFICLFILIIYPYLTFAEQEKDIKEKYVPVSIINLIATPEKYHGKKVRIKGFSIIRFEHSNIYLSEEDAKHANYKNSIFLELRGDWEKYEKYDRKYVDVKGIFNISNLKVIEEYSGSLKEIKIGLWIADRWKLENINK